MNDDSNRAANPFAFLDPAILIDRATKQEAFTFMWARWVSRHDDGAITTEVGAELLTPEDSDKAKFPIGDLPFQILIHPAVSVLETHRILRQLCSWIESVIAEYESTENLRTINS